MLVWWLAVNAFLAVPHGRSARVGHATRRAHAFAVAPADAVDSLDAGVDAAAAAHPALRPPPASILHSVPDPIEATLELLEWSRLSAHVARFASSKHARELCAAGLELPTTQLESETLLQETAEAYAIEQTLGRPLELKGFTNWQPLVSLASKGAVLEGEQLASVSASLAAAAALVKKLRAVEPGVLLPGGGSLSMLPSLFEGVGVQAALKLAIDEAVDDAGFVRDSASQGLGEIRFAMRELAAAIRKTLAEIVARRGECLANRTPTRRAERFVLQVVAKQRHRVPGVVRDVSGSGLTLFIEPKEIEGANTKLRQLVKREQALVQQVLQRLSQRLGSEQVALEMETLHLAITRVDVAAARARYGHALGGTPPIFTDVRTDGLRLPRLFHPLLLSPTPGEPPQPAGVVAQDYELPSHVRAVVVTGPNTGGKTVALKNLGLAVLMAKAGLWPVCSQAGADGPPARVPWFDVVMADIGDEQSLVQSLSTFSAHVARIKSILGRATQSSLVLLDEVGAGTDPTEGSALGAAVLRRLANRTALTMCTTHHSSLKTLKYNDPAFENACVEFDDVRMAPTYRLLWGIPGRSNALSIARRLGLQEDVLSDAVAALGSGEADVTALIERMQKDQADQRVLRAQLSALRDEATAARDEMRRQAEAQAVREAAAAAAQQVALQAELTEAREQLSALIADARASGAQPTGSKAMHEIAQIGRRAAAKSGGGVGGGSGGGVGVGGGEPAAVEVEVGDRVVVLRLGEAPVLVSERKGKQLTVAFGGLTMKVKLAEVAELIKPDPAPQPTPRRVSAGRRERSGTTAIRLDTNTLDIRGMRPADIGDSLAQAIDQSLDLGTLYVIHGRGSGALRASVREALAEEPMVARFEDATDAEGGNGCTIAYLK